MDDMKHKIKGFMVDTNIFNEVLDNDTLLETFQSEPKQFFSTHIQLDEINRTKDQTRKNKLLMVF